MNTYDVNYSGCGIPQYPITITESTDHAFWFRLSLFLGNGHMTLNSVTKNGTLIYQAEAGQ